MRFGILLILYILISTFALTALPVFSDEAIYIRWAQIATNEPAKYAFLPMLDGKPPLHVWSLIPFLTLIPDPLFAGRLLSVCVGAVSIILIGKFVQQLGGHEADERIAQLITMITPFWFFHHRMALADGMLTMMFLAGFVTGIQAYKEKQWRWVVLFALSVGGALWIKVSALFFVPVYMLLPALIEVSKKQHTSLVVRIREAYLHAGVLRLFLGGFLGGLIFLLLRFSPLFPFLFTRSADYTFTIHDLINGEWKFVLLSAVPRLGYWLAWYLSPFVLVLALGSGAQGIVLLLMALAYATPLLAGGKVVYSRYFLPLAVPLTVMAVIGFRRWYHQGKRRATLALVCGGGIVVWSLAFMLPSYLDAQHTPFAIQDREQYLTAWSSGFGIPQVRDYLREAMKEKKIEVGTEGYFGTLPDGLAIYFARPEDAGKIAIDGVGQPIYAIPEKLVDSSRTTETYLVVNSHRFLLSDRSHYEVVAAYERPYGGPSLLLLRILPQKQ